MRSGHAPGPVSSCIHHAVRSLGQASSAAGSPYPVCECVRQCGIWSCRDAPHLSCPPPRPSPVSAAAPISSRPNRSLNNSASRSSGRRRRFRRLTTLAGTCGPRRALPSVPVVFPPRILSLAKDGRFPPTRALCGTLSGRFRALRSHCANPLGEELCGESLQTVVLGAELFRSGAHGTVSMAPPHEGGELRLVGVVAGREGVDATRSVGA